MKNLNLVMMSAGIMMCAMLSAQTNPAAFDLSSGNFTFTGFADEESTTYPANTRGWSFGSEPGNSFTGVAAADRDLSPQSSNASSGSIRNEGAAGISFLNSGSNHIGALALALNTEGRDNLFVSYVVEDIRDAGTRQNGMALQYRIGDEGDFTFVAGTSYLSDPEGFAPAQTFSDVALPAETADQPLVQIRWLYFYEAGGGARDRISLNNIVVGSDEMGTGEPVDITFRVDMSEFTGTIDASGMHIAGNFPTDTWTPGARSMTDEGDGIWSWTETGLEPGFALEYKFVRGNDWPFGDENMGGQPCAAGGTTNRALTVPAETTTLPAVCYESCNPCNEMAETSMVTFRVDMSQQTIEGDGAGISGGFNGFAFQSMNNEGDGIYSYTAELEQGATIEYKFRNGEAFEAVPDACGFGDFNNRQVIVGTEDMVLDIVCYGACMPCQAPGAEVNVTFTVDASEIDIDAAGMHIAGSFNGFEPEPMTDAGEGLFTFTTAIESGTTATWKYLNGATFDGQEIVPEACGADDGFGGFNRSLEVPEEDTMLDTVCFESCEACVTEPVETVNVTFFVDMSLEDIDPLGVGISGTFNDFTFQEMTNQGAGLYSFTIALESGQTYDYKFRNGEAFEDVAAACGTGDDGNRQIETGEEDIISEPVCYGACEACGDPVELVTLTLQVDVSQIEVNPAGIHIGGSFNGFTPEPMTFGGADIYTFEVDVEPNTTVTWKYLNGDSFDNDETVPVECGSPDGFGGFNRTFDMPNSDFVFDVVCYGSCTACQAVVENVTVTFQVDASALITVLEGGIHIAGSFNDYSPQPMTDVGDNIYTFNAEVEPGTTLLWKYLNGDSFDDAETVPEACGVDDGFGGFNRTFIVPELDQVLEVVCFNLCEACVPDFVYNSEKRENFTLFPNPNNGDFSIVAPASGAVDLRIFDLTGRLIHANRFLTVEGEVVEYALATPENGYYIVELKYDNKFYGTRIVVQK